MRVRSRSWRRRTWVLVPAEDEKKNYEAMKGSVMEEVRRIFKPEFLNRIDEMIVFHALTEG